MVFRPVLLALLLGFVASPAFAETPTKNIKPLPATPLPAAEPEVTGLVLDARGYNYTPRMSPRMFDDSAHNLLDGLSFDPDKVTSDGFACWVRSYNPQEEDPRVGKHPMFMKPVRIDGGDRLIFSAEDGAKLKAANAKDKFLERLRVLIIY